VSRKAISSLLLIEDNLGDARLLREMLNEDQPRRTVLTHVASMAAAVEYLATNSVDLILLDLGLPDAEGVEAVRRAHAAAPRAPLVILTGLDDEELAGRALQEGAQDYLIKGQIDARGLLRALRYAVERNIMEDALFLAHERTQVTLDCIAEGVACTDVSGRISFLNAVAERMTGWSSRQAVGRELAEVFCSHKEVAGAPCSASLEAVAEGHTINVAHDVFRRADGTTFAAEFSSAPMRDSKGMLIGAVMAVRDISERRAMERLKDEFVSTVSHELRTPLTSIRGALGLLSSGMLGPVAGKGQRMLQIAVANTDRLVRLINDILDIERLDSGRIELNRTLFEASALMTHAIESVQTMADAAGVTLVLTPCEGRVLVDGDRIIQTLTNLLGNAIKFSPSGTTVTVSGRTDGDHLTIRVADQGRGIPDDKVGLIFERFKQVDASDSRDKGGSGLGLAISSSIVAAHGGRIWTEKNGEQGSVFLFTLPVAHETEFASVPVLMEGLEEGPTVLIIEDDADLYRVISAELQAQGVRTVHAPSGRAGIAAFLAQRPQLIVLDLVLPDIDGYAVIEALRSQPLVSSMPLVVYSALEVGAADQRRLRLGPTAFLTKSKASLRELAARVGDLLEAVAIPEARLLQPGSDVRTMEVVSMNSTGV
jgi:PAS domain S-box-containing protein